MSTIPLSTEKVLQATVKLLKFGNFLSSDADVDKIFSIPNNATEADINSVLSTINFGSLVAGADSLYSNEDINVYIDADNDDSYTGTVRYFRVAQDQSGGQVTDPTHELMTVGEEMINVFPPKPVTVLTVGSNKIFGTARNGMIHCGVDNTGEYYISLIGGLNAIGGTTNGAGLDAPYGLDISTPDIWFRSPAGSSATPVGGWHDIASGPSGAKFVVGDYTDNGLFIYEKESTTPGHYYSVIEPKAKFGYPRLYISADDSAHGDPVTMLIGIHPDVSFYSDPTNYQNSVVTIIGKDNSSPLLDPVLYLRDRTSSRATGSSIFTIHAESGTSNTWYAMRVFYNALAVFNIDSNGDVNIGTGSSYNTAGADVAEIVITDNHYAPGTVLIIKEGIFTKSQAIGTGSVGGVVATAPGVVFGKDRIYDESEKVEIKTTTVGDTISFTTNNKIVIGSYILAGNVYSLVKDITINKYGPKYTIHMQQKLKFDPNIKIYGNIQKRENTAKMAVTGFVPTKCSTINGDILGNGELLVSGPNGCAVLAAKEPYEQTAVVGKAVGRLIQQGCEPEIGIIEVQIQ